MSKSLQTCYTFGPFRLDTRERLLLRDGEIVPLTAKVFDTLVVMVENNGHALEKEDLIRRLWPDTFVEEGNLTQNVSRLRKVLVDDSGRQYIETLPRRGYRFMADVREIEPEDTHLIVRRRRMRMTLTEETEDAADDAPPATPALPETITSTKSLAVLPFMTLGMGPDSDYLGLGLADALITQLGSTGQMAVRPTSAVRNYAGAPQDSAQIGRDLRVGAVLEGSLQRAGERLRLTVQLVSVRDEMPIWAEKFDLYFTDIFEVQDAIAEQVARALVLRLSGEERARLTKRHTESAEAYQAYLKGRYFWNKRNAEGHHKAIELFNLAIEHDPAYALAYAGLSDAYNTMAVWGEIPSRESAPRAKAAAIKALELDKTLAEAHASLGYTITHYDWDWAGGERSYKRALELNPNYATAHQWYAKLLVAMERFDEAHVEMQLAQQLDPLSLMVNTAVVGPYLYSRQYDRAIEYLRRVLDLDPNFIPALFTIGESYMWKGMFDEALAARQKVLDMSSQHPFALAGVASAYARAGRMAEARTVLARLLEIANRSHVSTYSLATIYANLGEADRAFHWLEVSYQERDGHLVDLNVEPCFDGLRSDPRFIDLLRRVGLTPHQECSEGPTLGVVM